jgi:hypothetical protein
MNISYRNTTLADIELLIKLRLDFISGRKVRINIHPKAKSLRRAWS